ncbi:MAG: S9 family peptidase [Myxococcota bacterium]
MHNDPSAHLDVQRLVALARVGTTALSPCGTWMAVCVQRLDTETHRYVSDLWSVPLDRSADPVRLTRGPWNDTAPAFRADGTLGFLSNRPTQEGKPEEDHDKRQQVWVLPLRSEPQPLTDEPLGVSSFQFAQTGDRFVVIAPVLLGVAPEQQREEAADRRKHGPSARRYTQMPVRYWDHWLPKAAPHVIAYDGTHHTDLTPEADRDYRNTTWDLSPDGSTVAIIAKQLAPDQNLSGALRLIDTHSGQTRTVPSEPLADLSQPHFAPNGQTLVVVRNVRSPQAIGSHTLWRVDLATAEGHPLTSPWDRWPTIWGWTPDSSHLLATADDQGLVPVFIIDIATGARTRITHPDAGGTHSHLAATPDGTHIVGVRHRITHPPEPFIVPRAEDQNPELLTSLSGFTPEEGAAIAQVTSSRVSSTDGTSCQSFLVTPQRTQGPVPLILWIHGGPMSQWSDGWHWRWNTLIPASKGYAIALPNPRGSTGEGQAFIEGIWGNTWGGQCYADLMAVTDAYEAHDAIDEGRIAAMGGSFGGYMTNWIGTQTDRFRCLITHASIYSMPLFTGVTDMPAWWRLSMGGIDPIHHPDRYSRYSPESHMDGWTSPTLILHGDLDYRVPIGEALALFDALQARGIASELVVWPDENHWILKPRNIISWYEHVLRFLEVHLDTEASTAP